MQKVLVIVGPTASGKSALAVKLAKKLDGEIISADSRQVYRGLNIGTGKITRREMRGVRHHLLDVASPKKAFSANDFVLQGRRAIGDIQKRGKLPIICGGTGFYIDALLGRVALAQVERDPALREKLQKKTAAQLFALLKKQNPARAAAMDTPSERNNKARIVRALEVAASHPPRSRTVLGQPAVWIGIKISKEKLRKKMRARLASQLRQGMIAEAKRLHAQGLSYKRMRELGLEYRYMADHLEGRITRQELQEQLEAKIWQYAKRQMTYWKKNTDIIWGDGKKMEKHIEKSFSNKKSGGVSLPRSRNSDGLRTVR